MTDADRAVRAFEDVVAVEWDADAGVARVVTLSDVYTAVPDQGMHLCPDREYHDVDICKHLVAVEATRGRLDIPEGWLTVQDLDERTDPEFEIDRPPRIGRDKQLQAFTDGGDAYDRHDIVLRDVADADDDRCPDDMDGCLVVSYRAVNDANATYTESREVSTRLPTEMLTLFDGGVLDVSDLEGWEREWLAAESELYSNQIDFAGTETGPEVHV